MHLNSCNVGVISLPPVIHRFVHSFFQSTFPVYLEYARHWRTRGGEYRVLSTQQGGSSVCVCVCVCVCNYEKNVVRWERFVHNIIEMPKYTNMYNINSILTAFLK